MSSGELLALVVPAGVEGQCADQLAGVLVEDPDVQVVDQHQYAGAGVPAADAEVMQAAVVPQGEFAVAVDAVAADPEVFVDEDPLPGRCRLRPGGVGSGRGTAVDAAVWALVVVVGGERVELGLQRGDTVGARLAG